MLHHRCNHYHLLPGLINASVATSHGARHILRLSLQAPGTQSYCYPLGGATVDLSEVEDRLDTLRTHRSYDHGRFHRPKGPVPSLFRKGVSVRSLRTVRMMATTRLSEDQPSSINENSRATPNATEPRTKRGLEDILRNQLIDLLEDLKSATNTKQGAIDPFNTVKKNYPHKALEIHGTW